MNEGHRRRGLAVVCGVSVAAVLAQAVVFSASGLMLFAIGQGMGWSATAMGTAYMLIVLGACAGSPMSVFLMRAIGGRWTVVAGQLLLAATFTALAFAGALAQLYACAGLMGVAFSLSGNTPGVYLISGWTGPRASGLIGLYLMVAMIGSAVGPPAAQSLIGGAGWQGYAFAVAALAVLVAALCALALRDPPEIAEAAQGTSLRALGTLLRSRTFLILATAMVTSQTCLVTVASVAPAHLALSGLPEAFTARLLGAEGIASALATGLLGHFAGRLGPRRMLPLTLLACGGGMVILATLREPAMLHVFAILLGAGVGGATLAVTLLLVRYFGAGNGSALLGAVWTLAGLAAVGPWIAGLVADAAGSYAPALLGLGVAMAPVAAACLLLPGEE